jgi:hypothetical protein
LKKKGLVATEEKKHREQQKKLKDLPETTKHPQEKKKNHTMATHAQSRSEARDQ